MSTAAVANSFRPSRRAARAAGQPISALMSQALANPDLISLAAGFVDQPSLPVEATSQALSALFADPSLARASLQYGTTHGHVDLRRHILARSEATDALQDVSLDQLLVTAGSNQLLHLVAETLLEPGDIVLCAAPTYLVFLGTIANLGARSLGVTSDEQGMVPAALNEVLQRLERGHDLGRVKAIYLVPYSDNPRGITMPLNRVVEIVELAQRWSTASKIHVIADEAYRELRYSGTDLPSARTADERGDTVIVAGTFSKSFSPGVRVGWGLLPPHLVEPVCNQKGNIDFGSPNFNQCLMAKVMELGLFERHVEEIRDNYQQKLRAMLAAADEHLGPLEGVRWTRPTGGLYVWVTLPTQIDTGPQGALFDAAIDQGVLYVPGQYAYPTEGGPIQTNTMRLSFGVPSCEQIRSGVESLARAIREV